MSTQERLPQSWPLERCSRSEDWEVHGVWYGQATGCSRKGGQESHEEKQGDQTWHKLLITVEKRHLNGDFQFVYHCWVFQTFSLAISIKSLVTQL